MQYGKGVLLSRPLGRVSLLRRNTFVEDAAAGLVAHQTAKMVLFTGEASNVAPKLETEAAAKALADRFPGRTTSVVLEGSGYGAADQILDQAVIADHVTRLA